MRLFEAVSALALLSGVCGAGPSAPWHPDWPTIKERLRGKLTAAAASGKTPIFDVESSYQDAYLNPAAVQASLDERDVAVVAWSAEVDDDLLTLNQRSAVQWPVMLESLTERFPNNVLPVPPAGRMTLEGMSKRKALKRLEAGLADAETAGYPLLGEYFFRHYSSNQNAVMGVTNDFGEAIDGPLGEMLFRFSERTGKLFEIHYEIEDALLPPLEAMLVKYPKARVIWCHAGRLRRPHLARQFEAAPVQTLKRLLRDHPNLYFDLGALRSGKYFESQGPVALWWDEDTHHLRGDWQSLLLEYPWRFLAALDIGGDRAQETPYYADEMRRFLLEIPNPQRDIIAYKAAWKLIFDETLGDKL